MRSTLGINFTESVAMNKYFDLNADVLDESAILILKEISNRPQNAPITLYELLDISPIEKAISAYKKILELDSYNYLRMTVDHADNRVHYVSLTEKTLEILEEDSTKELAYN